MTEPTLSLTTLSRARAGSILPQYDPRSLRTGIVHLGLGAFVRAHVATYTDDVLAERPGAWGIIGVSLRSPDQRDALAPQDCLYTAVRRDGRAIAARIVGCVRRALVAPDDPAAVVAAMADASCRIVSLTITEKGYCHDPATGRLDPAHPDIAHDLAHPDAPRTAVGLIVAALRARRDAGIAPFTVLCCDNLPHNGALVAGLVRKFASRLDPSLAAWIAAEGAFPSTMVDRIVPAATEADRADAARLTGLADAAAISHEPFRQWVIEDRFVGGARPDWERAGAQIVADVAPFEHMKLRFLNGAHSALAYLGYLAGYKTIPDTVADPAFRRYAALLWDEIIAVVPPPPGVDLRGYAADLMRRFENPAIRHRTWQIAMDGSQKLPQRLLGTIRERLAAGLPIDALALAVAAWIRYVGGVDERGAAIDVRDPLAARLRALIAEAGDDPARRVAAVLGEAAVFGTDLPGMAGFAEDVTRAYRTLLAEGAHAAVSGFHPG